MRTSKFTIASLSFAILLGLGCFWLLPSTVVRQVDAAEPASSKLKGLYTERIEVLKGIVQLAITAHERAEASVDQVFQAKIALLKAEIDQTDSAESRIANLEQIVQLAVERERAAKVLFEKGVGSTNEMLHTKAERLNAEIAVERAKAG